MVWPEWKRVFPHLTWSKAFWSDMTKCQDRETCKTAWWERFSRSCQDNLMPKDTEKAEALSALFAFVSAGKVCSVPPSSACLAAKIWREQAARGSGRLSEVLLHLDVHKPMVLPTRHSRRLRGLAGAAARLPKSNQQLLMSDILQKPGLHRRKGGRSRKCFMLAGMVGALEDSPASQEKLDKLQKCVDRNIMGSARS